MMFLGQGVRENIRRTTDADHKFQLMYFRFQEGKKKQEKIKIKYMLIKDAKPADLVECSLGNLFSGFIDK